MGMIGFCAGMVQYTDFEGCSFCAGMVQWFNTLFLRVGVETRIAYPIFVVVISGVGKRIDHPIFLCKQLGVETRIDYPILKGQLLC